MKKRFNLENVDVDFFESDIDIEELEENVDEELEAKVREFLELDYPISISKDHDELGEYWLAEHPDLPGCKSHGKSKEEALKNLEEAKINWIYSYADLGKEIPKPNQLSEIENCSGKILLRIPKELHFRLISEAKNNGVSLNQEIMYLLSNSIGTSKIENYLEKINQKLDYIQVDKKFEDKSEFLYSKTLETLEELFKNDKKSIKAKERPIDDIFGLTYERTDRNKLKHDIVFEEFNPYIQ